MGSSPNGSITAIESKTVGCVGVRRLVHILVPAARLGNSSRGGQPRLRLAGTGLPLWREGGFFCPLPERYGWRCPRRGQRRSTEGDRSTKALAARRCELR